VNSNPKSKIQNPKSAALSGRALTALLATEGERGPTDPGSALVTRGGSASLKRLNSHAVHALLTQANLHRMRGQYTEAVDCCVAVLQAQPSNAAAHSLLGDIYREQDKWEDAVQWYRMAVELRPTPADQARLTDAERERQCHEAVRGGKKGRGTNGSDLLTAGVGLNTGTSNLMGVSPRRWLRGIWITSLSFLAIVLIALIALQPQRRDTARNGAKVEPVSASGSGTGLKPSPLPPLDPSHRNASTSMGTVGRSPSVTGPGLPPDPSAPGNRAAQPAPTAPEPTTSTAPVLDVRPLENTVGRAPRDQGPGDTAQNALQPMPLTGNLRFVQVKNIGDGAAAVIVEAPQELGTDSSNEARDLLVRNIFRAARTAFAENALYSHATIFIQATMPATGGGEAVLMEASLDRATAATTSPDTDPLESLTARLQGFKWTPARMPDGGTAEITVSPDSGSTGK
jgi:hypothetical protein